jgi:hypothetical protein
MKKTILHFAMAMVICLVFLTSCKKSSDAPAQISTVDSSSYYQQNADGQVYCLYAQYKSKDPVLGINSSVYSANAWFGNYQQSKDAGTVTCANVPLYLSYSDTSFLGQVTQVNNPIYFTKTQLFGTALPFDTTKNVLQWVVAGNAANNITGFTLNDSTAWPKLGYFNVPDTISVSSPLTLTYSFKNYQLGGSAYDYLILTFGGGSTRKNVVIDASKTSYTISAADLQTYVGTNNSATIQLTLTKISNFKTFGSKKYVAVKQQTLGYFVPTK